MHTHVLKPDAGMTCNFIMHIQHCMHQGHSGGKLCKANVLASGAADTKQRHNCCMLAGAAYKAMTQSLVQMRGVDLYKVDSPGPMHRQCMRSCT